MMGVSGSFGSFFLSLMISTEDWGLVILLYAMGWLRKTLRGNSR